MELKINLSDREDIAAAHTLLATLLGATAEVGTTQVYAATVNAPRTGGASMDDYVAHLAQQTVGQTDPAAAFAANPLPQAGALSTAGAGLPAIAPGALPGSLPVTTGQPQVAPGVLGQAAPTASAAAASSPVSNVPLDANGLPWDERIHAGTKGRNKDNTWTYKRGVDKATIPVVEGELRARVGAATATGLPGPSVGYVEPQANPANTPSPAAVGAITTALGLAGAMPLADPTTFEQIMPRVTAAVNGGVMPATVLQQACEVNGISGVVALQQNPAAVPLVWATLKQAYPALQ